MFERQHVQAAKAYARKPKPGAGSTPFFTKASASEPAAKKSRTEEPTESGSRPNLPPDAGTGAFKKSMFSSGFNPCYSRLKVEKLHSLEIVSEVASGPALNPV